MKLIFQKAGLLVLTCLLSCQINGQDMAVDTLFLDEVVVSGIDEDDYGATQLRTDLSASEILTDLNSTLRLQTAIPINEYGARGQLASINLRGLGASRTAVLWQGIPLNSFTNGQVDLNLISSAGASRIALNKGAASALYGNGAIGGSINFTSIPSFNQKPLISIGQSIGSFGFQESSVDGQWGNDRFAVTSKAGWLYADNDFTYDSRGEEIRQRNAEFKAYNIFQEVGWLVNDRSLLHFSLWMVENDRQIQPSRNDFSSDDKLFDKNTRLSLQYVRNTDKWTQEAAVAYTRDFQIFNENDPLIVNQYYARAQIETSFWNSFHWVGGINNSFLQVQGSSIDKNSLESRTDVFSLLSNSWSKSFSTLLNVRQPLVDGRLRPIAPTFISRWQPFSNRLNMQVEGQMGRSFRLPTLNDRFWNPGGNEDLQAETSLNADFGIESSYELGLLIINAQASTYWNEVSNWIVWTPGGREMDEEGRINSFWFPQNLESVRARGIEYEFGLELTPVEKILLDISYQGTKSEAINRINLGENDRSFGKQLAFTPTHISLTSIGIAFYGWQLRGVRSLVGQRFTEANNELTPLPEYILYNLSFSKSFSIRPLQVDVAGDVRNITNEDYESYENRAMPGINYNINLKITYTFL